MPLVRTTMTAATALAAVLALSACTVNHYPATPYYRIAAPAPGHPVAPNHGLSAPGQVRQGYAVPQGQGWAPQGQPRQGNYVQPGQFKQGNAASPGQGNAPTAQGGQGEFIPPGHGSTPPGQSEQGQGEFIPPGHGSTPPGQLKQGNASSPGQGNKKSGLN